MMRTVVDWPLRALVIVSATLVVPAQAQQGDSNLVLEIIEVVAQKRRERLLDVPITITAYEGGFLDTLGITDLEELSEIVPGLTIQLQSPNNSAFVIRGITSDDGNFQITPRVSVYYNGVDVSRSRGAAFEMFDLDHVEVVKGPQSTLFGTAASIGAVSVHSARPQQDLEISSWAGVGNEGYARVGGYITGGNETVQGRLAGQYRKRDGYVTNLVGPDDLSGIETVAVRGSLRFTPNEDITADLVVTYEENTPPGTAFKSGVITPPGGDTSPHSPAALGGPFDNDLMFGYGGLQLIPGVGIVPALTPLAPDAAATFLGGNELGLDRELLDINLTVDANINSRWSITGIAAMREFDSLEIFDADGSQVPLVEATEDSEGDQYSFEVRFNYDGGDTFRGFAGMSLFHEDGFQRTPLLIDETLFAACIAQGPTSIGIAPTCVNPDGSFNRFNIDPATAPFAPLIPAAAGPGIFYPTEFENRGDYDILSVFADGTWTLRDNLELTLGVRFITEDRESSLATQFPNSALIDLAILNQAVGAGITDPNLLLAIVAANGMPLLPGFVTTNGQFNSASEDYSAVLPRLNLLWTLRENMNLYFTIAKGRRSPVISLTQAEPTTPVFLPAEEIWNLEGGIKAVVAGGKLQLDAALFYQEYSDFGVTIVDLAAPTGIRNAATGNAKNVGLEASAFFQVNDALQLFGSFAWIDAKIDNDPANGIFAGNRFRLQPQTSGSLGLNYERQISERLNFFVTPTVSYRGDVFFEAENLPRGGLPITDQSVTQVDLRAGVESLDGRLKVSLFANNLFDEDYLVDAGNVGGAFGTPTFIAGPPALYGVEVRLLVE